MTIYQNGFFSSTLFVRSVQFPVFDYNATLSNTNLTENVYGPFTGTGAIQLRLSGLSRDIDLELWRDVDSNGTLDTAVDFLVASSRNTGTAEEVIQTSEQQPNSNVRYFAVIKAYDTIPANTVTGYTLNVSRIINTDAPSINPSNVNLSISGASKFSKSVETVEFNSSSSGRVNFRFSNNDVNALALFADSNNNGIFDQGDQLVKRASGTNSLTSDLGTGAYYLQLSGPTLASGAGNLLVTTDRPKNSDFNGDGKNDIVVQGEGWAGVWTMNGSTVTSWAGFVSTNGTSASTSGAKIVGVGDFNRDGKNDIVLQNQAAGWAGIWGMNGSTVTYWNGLPSTSGGNIVGVGDFNGDGNDDLVLQGAGWAGVWGMTGTDVTSWSGLVSTNGTSASTSGAKIVGVGDFNGDGKNDIVLQNQAAGWAGIWGMNGSTVTSWAGLPSTSGGNIVGVGDFNSDGKNDLVLQEAGWAGIWTMNGSSVTGWAGLPSTSGGRIVV